MRSLTLGAYITGQWLPGKKINLAQSTWDGYRRKIDRHILPAIGHLRIRRLRARHLETLYDRILHPTDGRRALAPKTALEVHLIIRGALQYAVRQCLVSRNVARVAHAARLRAIPRVEPAAQTAQQYRLFCRLQQAIGSSFLGFRRDRDSPQRASRTPLGRRRLQARTHLGPPWTAQQYGLFWRDWQGAEQEAGGVESESWVFTNTDSNYVHPHSISQTFERIATPAGVPRIRLHDIRHTHGTLLIKAGVPVKVVSERLGHGNPAFTIDTYQHVLPGMQAEAARTFEQLIKEQMAGTAGRSDSRRTA